MADMADMDQKDSVKSVQRKEYFSPKIVHTEKMEGRAVTCALADDHTCGAGPIQS